MFSLGSDPEIFIKKDVFGQIEYFPAVEVIEGDKDNPQQIDDEGRAILVDNVMVEFNTLPTHNIHDFIEEHERFMQYLIKELGDKECLISKSAYVEFKPDFLQSEIAQQFGCEPDTNAYTEQENKAPNPNTNFRSAAGHIHIGYKGHSVESTLNLIKLLDLTIGLQSVIDDKDRNRRKMYGKAGAFRFKEFGFEYRVLSNYWIFDKDYMSKIYRGIEKAFLLHANGFKLTPSIEKKVIRSINTYNVNMANKIINEELNIII